MTIYNNKTNSITSSCQDDSTLAAYRAAYAQFMNNIPNLKSGSMNDMKKDYQNLMAEKFELEKDPFVSLPPDFDKNFNIALDDLTWSMTTRWSATVNGTVETRDLYDEDGNPVTLHQFLMGSDDEEYHPYGFDGDNWKKPASEWGSYSNDKTDPDQNLTWANPTDSVAIAEAIQELNSLEDSLPA